MKSTYSEEFRIKAPGGTIYARKWIPDKILSDIPVVLLHDSLGCVDLWRNFPETLAINLCRSIIAYDRLGFGKSDGRDGLPSLDFIEEEATRYFPAVKSALSISEYILFGYSVGGGMSINIASRDSDCRAVITMSSQAFVEKLTVSGIEEAKKGFEQPGQFERLEKWHGKKAKWVLRAWTDIWCSPEFSGWSLESCIGKVSCPVLAIHGDRDEYGSRAFPEFISGRAGGVSEMRIIKDCGHMPHKEKTDEVINAVREFLDGNSL
jgi:pimeloyl-ACP methyl ester carboxylesterase